MAPVSTKVGYSEEGRRSLLGRGTALCAKALKDLAGFAYCTDHSDAALAWGVPDSEPRRAEADQAGGDHTCPGCSVRFQFVLPCVTGRLAVSRSKFGALLAHVEIRQLSIC